jgi:peptidyl serine alpha-galactosyltransferase
MIQHYGLGGVWTRYKLADIVGTNDTAALHVSEDDADKYYAVGPPYFAHTRDWLKITKLWTEYVPATLAADPGILQEMYAYCIATAHLKMPHVG